MAISVIRYYKKVFIFGGADRWKARFSFSLMRSLFDSGSGFSAEVCLIKSNDVDERILEDTMCHD